MYSFENYLGGWCRETSGNIVSFLMKYNSSTVLKEQTKLVLALIELALTVSSRWLPTFHSEAKIITY